MAFPSLFTSMAFLCACNSLSSRAFFEFSLSAENMQHYLRFLKSFPCGKIGVLPESLLIWACVATHVHIFSASICPALSCPRDGNPIYKLIIQVVFLKYLNFRILNDKVRGQALASFRSALESDLLSHTDWERAVFTLLFTHFFFPSLNPEEPSCSHHRGLKESYHRQLIA